MMGYRQLLRDRRLLVGCDSMRRGFNLFELIREIYLDGVGLNWRPLETVIVAVTPWAFL